MNDDMIGQPIAIAFTFHFFKVGKYILEYKLHTEHAKTIKNTLQLLLRKYFKLNMNNKLKSTMNYFCLVYQLTDVYWLYMKKFGIFLLEIDLQLRFIVHRLWLLFTSNFDKVTLKGQNLSLSAIVFVLYANLILYFWSCYVNCK